MIDASVVVVSHNRRSLLEKCIHFLSLQDCGVDRYEIIVVDDGSSDDTWEMLSNLSEGGVVKPLKLAYRMGPAIARNKALEIARGKVVIFTDSDAFAAPSFVREHLKCHEQYDRLIVDGPAVNISMETTSMADPFRSLWSRIQASLDFGGATFVTVNTSCRREHLEACGGFDADFSNAYGWEDIELGRRLIGMGLRRVKNRAAMVLHCSAGQQPIDVELTKRMECGKNAILYYRKHPDDPVRRDIGLDRLNLEPFLTPLAGHIATRRGTHFGIAKSLLLRHSYILGLKQGIDSYGLPDMEKGERPEY